MTTNYFCGLIPPNETLPRYWKALTADTLTNAKGETIDTFNNGEWGNSIDIDMTEHRLVIGTDYDTIGMPIQTIRERRHDKWYKPSKY
jgi:hypothetical protein